MTDTTKRVIAEMLCENTGTHLLDSGGAYGRNWERNKGKTVADFDAEPHVTLEFWPGNYRQFEDTGESDSTEINATINLFHWLHERVEFDEDMQARFDKFVDSPEREDTHWLQDMQDFAESIGATGPLDGGEGDPVIENSYNSECLLSQTIQYVWFKTPDTTDDEGFIDEYGDCYILLQIHGGCDVRGGYTKPRAFRVGNAMDEYAMLNYCETGIDSPDGDMTWYTYDGSNFESSFWNGPDPDIRKQNLEEFPCTNDETKRGKGVIYIDDDHNGYCPLSGSKLV